MNNKFFIKSKKGFSLIELLIVLVISSVFVAAAYGYFINQQRSYNIQDQIAETQQNMRFAIDRMTREIRMAGYGGDILWTFPNINGFTNIITAINGANSDSITIIMADEVAKLSQNATSGSNQLTLDISNANEVFNSSTKRYLCLNGQNNYQVSSASGNTVTLTTSLFEDHLINESVALVKAITYQILPNTTDLVRNENTGEGNQVLADHIENLQLRYTLSDGSVVDSPANPSEIRGVTITISGRTRISDPTYPGDGFRRQVISSQVEIRNLNM